MPTTKYNQTRVIYTTNIQLMANAMLKFNCTTGRMSDISIQTSRTRASALYSVCIGKHMYLYKIM